MKEVNILGRSIGLQERTKGQLKGITIGDSLSYRFYDGEYLGVKILFLEPKKENPTPRECSVTASRLADIFNMPIVYILTPGPSYERQRLIDKNVFFVIGDKFVNLPMLVANERMRSTKPAKRLSPVAQYILFYHLQEESLEGLSAREMSSKLPYSYESITLGLTCLEDLRLCVKDSQGSKSKVVHFVAKGRELWDRAQEFVIDPVEKRIYCDDIDSDCQFPKCSINALAHYSRLNPDSARMIMMTKKQLKNLETTKSLKNSNEFDGNVLIEVCKYPVVSQLDIDPEWVDKLSLALSLSHDNDARVEREVERIIEEIEWKDC